MGEPTFARDGDRTILVLDGFEQSAVNLADPTDLAFEYVEQLALAVDMLLPPGPLRVTHVGGGGLTMARWVEHTRPGSPQIVLEPDDRLTARVRAELPLPRRHRIRVRPVGGVEGIGALADGSADLLILDAFEGGRVPAELTSAEWFAEVARVLALGGLLLANVADERDHGYLARVAAGVRESLGHVAAVGLKEVVKGRRFGNLILIGARRPVDLHALRVASARLRVPTGVLGESDLSRRHPQVMPFRAATGDLSASPSPPDPFGVRRFDVCAHPHTARKYIDPAVAASRGREGRGRR